MRLAAFAILIIWGGLNSFAPAEERAPVVPSFLMDLEPDEKPDPETFFLHPELFGLWKQAITHPESEMHRKVAESIAAAHKYGHEGLSVFQPELLNLLKQEKPLTPARYAAANALIVLDSRDSAAALFEASQSDGKDMRQLVEPALANWGFAPIQDVWIKRLQTPDTPRRELTLAIRGLQKCQVSASQPDILQIAMSPGRPTDIRLAAAQAAGELAESGLENSAQELLSRSTAKLIDRLCAASLLVKHRSPQAVELNTTLAQDAEPAVASLALRTLFETDTQTVLPLADACLKNPDAGVRRVAIQSYLQHPTAERIQVLSAHLNDPHVELRSLVREGFITHRENSEFAEQILDLSVKALNGDEWRAQEQGALLLATFDRKEVTPRLCELLPSNRHEVAIASAWALRVLAVPETASAITEQLDRQSKLTTSFEVEIETQVCHLSEALAVLKHKPATTILRRYIPKGSPYSFLARSAAIWSLGQIYEDAAAVTPEPPTKEESALSKAAALLGVKDKSEGELVEQLAEQFMDRIEDTESTNPEHEKVRRTCSLALGRMKAASQLESLKAKIGKEVDNEEVDIAMRWAVLRISGEDLPIAAYKTHERKGWFLEPVTRIPSRRSDVAP